MNRYCLSKEESDRINIIKYIAIILVVYIHAYAAEDSDLNGLELPSWLVIFENFISQVIARCGVSIFFLISAILLFKSQRDYKKTIKSKVKSLLVPYLIWNTFWILVFIILQALPFIASYFSGGDKPILGSNLGEWFALYGIGLRLPYPKDYPLWFMRDLMLVTLSYPIIGKIANKFPKQLLAISILLLVLPVSFPLNTAVLWFCVGACIVELQIHITLLDKVSMWKILLLYSICAFVTLILERSIVNMLFVFVGSAFWIRVSKCIYDSTKMRGVFLKLSEWTFMIYVAHELTLSSLKKLCFKLLPTTPIFLLIEYIMIPAAVIMGCTVAGAFLKRIAPKVYSITTGLR